MIDKPHFASLTRISDLDRVGYDVRHLEKASWATGDYVVGIVTSAVYPPRVGIRPCIRPRLPG